MLSIVAELQGIPGVCDKFAIEASQETQKQLNTAMREQQERDEQNEDISLPTSICTDTNSETNDAPQSQSTTQTTPSSPFRGKIHPVKVKKSVSTQETSEGQASQNQRDEVEAERQPFQEKKTFSQMSMMERQQEWLRKKAEKAEAEKLRQQQEKEKELTFQPDLMKKQTAPRASRSNNEETVTAEGQLMRSKSAGRQRRSSITSNKPAMKAKGPSSKSLLDSVKSELAASALIKPIAAPSTERKLHEKNFAVERSVGFLAEATKVDITVVTGTNAQQSMHDMALVTSANASASYLTEKERVRPFHFDSTSNESKARFQLQDPAMFDLTSIYRKKDKYARCDGVSLQMGRRDDTHEEQLIAVIFDRETFPTEDIAKEWYSEHQQRLHSYM
jgi:hypothetical protein